MKNFTVLAYKFGTVDELYIIIFIFINHNVVQNVQSGLQWQDQYDSSCPLFVHPTSSEPQNFIAMQPALQTCASLYYY